MSNTITQLEQQALDLQKKLDEMKATIAQQKQAEQESKKKENVFGLGGIKMEQHYSYVTHASNKLQACGSTRFGHCESEYYTAFNNKAKAEAIADAFNVLLELRACDGVVVADGDVFQNYIKLMKDGTIEVDSTGRWSGVLSPFFSSNQAAKDALAKVGEERVRKAFLAMQGTFNE